ncbi:pentatricopeptide repeat-containing protein At4g14190, chloroplastic isoform X2 [Hevea brasiliensis]|uniref:pentatricopeptide repeat-containing protein At4g14190, chloroplastic isoform X2 n=1 Tax=Hevea brasiliensis TaxID=3981 RepID=UPI0025F81EEE|nr:pentatricopeptide repeat-containing protein At4g14190, chloroplastic isoform X2 [Hevea brasiliensis]
MYISNSAASSWKLNLIIIRLGIGFGEVMDDICTLQNSLKILCTWKCKSNNNKIRFSKTLIQKPISQLLKPISCLHPLAPPHTIPQDNSTKHKTLLVESYHEHRRLKVLLAKLNKKGSCPLEMLQDDGDWSKEHFWAVIRFLKLSSRSKEVLQVFDTWKNIEKSRINEFNYEKIIGLLSEEDLMEDASLAFMEMKSFGLSPSLQIYNSLVHSYARNGKFDDALFYLNQMKETNLPLESDTYDGLIQAYGKYKMYDEMGMCLKKMELDGCSPDCFTYNLLIQEFAKAGLLNKMERVYQSMRTKRMDLRSSTLIAMLEAYVNFGIVEKMDKILRRVWNSKATLKEDLIRKMAVVYIENFMYSRLDDLGDDLSSRNAYLKMKDFTHLRMLLSKLTNLHVEPDIVTVGILFDACDLGFHGTGILETWRRMGLLYRCVEMQTDPLVLTAFGKGQFLRRCEEAYSSLDPNAREKKKWTYCNLIDLVAKNNGKQHQLNAR